MRKRYCRPIQLVQKMTFLVLLLLVPETRNKCSRYRSYTSRTKNNTTTKFKSIHYCLTYHVHHQHSPLWCQANGFRHQDLSQQVHLLCCRIWCHPKSIYSISCICKNTKGLLLSHGSNSKWSYSFSNVLLHKQCVVAQNSLLHKEERAMPPPPKKIHNSL